MIFRFLYDLLLSLFLLFTLPFWVWRYGIQKGRWSFLQDKLGLRRRVIPPPKTTPRIWIHAVSLGETKAVISLVEKIRKERPHLEIVFSTTTETGLQEAKRQFPYAQAHLLLPVDLSFIVRRFVQKWDPDLLVLVESDLWYNFLSSFPQVVLVNGKLSERSKKRYALAPFYTRRLFSHISFACVQNQEYADRFSSLGMEGKKIEVVGNLKLDQPIPSIDEKAWRKQLRISPTDRVITLGSTHAPEEREILQHLRPLLEQMPSLKILLVPRHPERFREVAEGLQKEKFLFDCLSDPASPQERRPIMLVDRMGVLSHCYLVSEVALVGGSFCPGVGGHNVLEPVLCGIPVLFGPYMENQKELASWVTQKRVGKEVPLSELSPFLFQWLSQPQAEEKRRCQKVAAEGRGVTNRVWEKIAL